MADVRRLQGNDHGERWSQLSRSGSKSGSISATGSSGTGGPNIVTDSPWLMTRTAMCLALYNAACQPRASSHVGCAALFGYDRTDREPPKKNKAEPISKPPRKLKPCPALIFCAT